VRLTIRIQLALAFAVPLVLLAISTALAIGRLHGMNASSDESTAWTTTRAKTREVMLAIVTYRNDVRGFVLYHDAKNHAKAIASEQKVRSSIGLVGTQLAGRTGTLRSTFDTAHRAAERILGSTNALLRYAETHRDDVVAGYGGRTATPSEAHARRLVLGAAADINASTAPLQALIDDVNARALQASAAVDAADAGAQRDVIICGVVAIVLTALCCVVLAGRIRSRLAKVSGALHAIVDEDLLSFEGVMRALADGDLTVQATSNRAAIPVRGSDEIGELTASYNGLAARMTQIAELTNGSLGRLSTAVAHVADTAGAVALASTQVSGASAQASIAVTQIANSVERVAQGSSEQAERIGSAGTAFEELARVAEQIAQGAAEQTIAVQEALGAVRSLEAEIGGLADHGQQLARSAAEAKDQTAAGSGAVAETAGAMRSMHARSTSAQQAMAALEERSHAVEAIVETIDEIADQTNLLALNAAIEAARAGEHGRGFAVVADEVRQLAERASTATREIAQILAAIRTETGGAAEAMRTSSSAVDGVLELATRANDALTRVGGVIATTSTIAGELAVRAAAMTSASTGLARSMGSVSSVVEENAAAAGQMRTTAGSVAQTVAPITRSARAQSAAAAEASVATNELAAGIEEMSATANALLEHAQGLRRVVADFRVRASAALPRKEAPALTA
jgi:methyl-accepting chemotaxis protein